MKHFIIPMFCFACAVTAQNYCALVTFPDDRHAFIDEKGNYLYVESKDPNAEEKLFSYKCGLGRIKRRGMFGYINHTGTVIIPVGFEKAEDFSEYLAAVRVDGKWGYIDTKGKIVIQPQFEDAMRFSEGVAIVKQNGKYGYIDKQGNYISEPAYERVCHFNNGKAWVMSGGVWGCINKKGETIIHPYYSDTHDFSEGYAWVKKDLVWGLIDSSNKYIISPDERNPLTYAHSATVKNFQKVSNGLLLMKSNALTGFCDLRLKKVIEFKFDDALGFRDGLCIAYQHDKAGIIDSTGNFIVQPTYKELMYLGHGFFGVKEKAGHWYGMTKTASIFTKPSFKKLHDFEPIEPQN